ncbi:MAG: hypothetical protein ACK4Q5_07455 [Saprospiraceae bacterium]
MERPKIVSKKKEPVKDLESLKNALKAMEREERGEALLPTEGAPKPRGTQKPAKPAAKVAKPRGRKKRQVEPVHRLTIDLPLTLFQQIESDADAQFSTIRSRIVTVLSAHYGKS